MDNLESYLIQKISPYDKKIQALTKSINSKDAELEILGHAYKNLLNDLEKLVGPEKYLEYVKQANVMANYVDELSPEEQLILLKMFDFTVPVSEADKDTLERIKTFKALIQKNDIKTLLTSPLFHAIVRSPEFDLIINSPDFGALAGNHELMALIKTPQFKKLASSAEFQELLAKNGLKLPLRPFDVQLPFKISLLRSMARLDRIFEDFTTNRCAPISEITDTESPTRAPLIKRMSPRKDGSFITRNNTNKTTLLETKLLQSSFSLNLNLTSSCSSPYKIKHDG